MNGRQESFIKIETVTWFVFLLLISTISSFSYAQISEEDVIAAVDPALETRWGEVALEETLKQYPVTTRQDYSDLVNKIGWRILNAINDRPELDDWKFLVVEANIENAFALPGGKIVVYTAYLKSLEFDGNPVNEEMLAGILGHEIAHVTQRHSVRSSSSRGSLRWLLNNLDSIEAKGKQGKLSNEELRKLFAVGESRLIRVQEFEADQLGSLYAALAGYGYSGGIREWERKISLGKDYAIEDYFKVQEKDGSFTVTADHPTYKERIAGMREFQKFLLNVAGEFNWGLYLLQSGNYEKATNCFKDVIKIFPRSFQAWNNLGKAYHMLYLRRNDPVSNQAHPKEKLQCDLVDYSVGLRGQVRGAQELKRAIDYYREAIRRNPNETGVQNNLAVALIQTREQENINEAEQILTKLLSRDQSNPSYLNHFGILMYTKNELSGSSEVPESVITTFQKAASLKHLPALYNLGYVEWQSGKKQEAEEHLKEYLQNDRKSPWGSVARDLLKESNAESPDKSIRVIPDFPPVLGFKLGTKPDEILKSLSEPDRRESAKTSEGNTGEILWYETSGISFVISEGRMTAVNIFRPQTSTLSPQPGLKLQLPEVAGIAIDSPVEKLIKTFGEPQQTTEVEEGPEQLYSYWDEEVKITFRVQYSKIRAISIMQRSV